MTTQKSQPEVDAEARAPLRDTITKCLSCPCPQLHHLVEYELGAAVRGACLGCEICVRYQPEG